MVTRTGNERDTEHGDSPDGGGSRALGRIHELIKAGEPITVRKLAGSTWEIRYGVIAPPLGPDSTTPQLLDSSRSQLGLF